jgi:hypothetical protein
MSRDKLKADISKRQNRKKRKVAQQEMLSFFEITSTFSVRSSLETNQKQSK